MGEDDFRDGTVGFEGKPAVRIRHRGVVTAWKGNMDRFHRFAGDGIDDGTLHGIAQPEGVLLAPDDLGQQQEHEQNQILSHSEHLLLQN